MNLLIAEELKELEDELAESISKLRTLFDDTDKLYIRWKYYDEPLTINDFWSLKERIKKLSGDAG